MGLVTTLGPVDVVLEPKGYEGGYDALISDATTCAAGRRRDQGRALADLVHSKELLRRDKDVEHLAQLYDQRPELAPELGPEPDTGFDLGL